MAKVATTVAGLNVILALGDRWSSVRFLPSLDNLGSSVAAVVAVVKLSSVPWESVGGSTRVQALEMALTTLAGLDVILAL